MADSFSIIEREIESVLILEINGYFAGEAGKRFTEIVDGNLRSRKTAFLVDFSKCTLISSPGIAALMENCMKITEDFKGRIAFFGLDQLRQNVFTVAGITEVAPIAPNQAEAIKLVK